MLRTPLALGMIAAASVTPATSVEASKCDGTRSGACLTIDAMFVRARNAEIEASIRVSNAQRAFTMARNKEIEASIAASNAWRMKEFDPLFRTGR